MNTEKARDVGLLAVLLVLVGGMVALSGAAVAADETVSNTTHVVDNDTVSAYADIENLNTTSTANVTVTFTGIDNGTETVLDSRAIQIGGGNLSAEEQAVDGSVYDEVRIEVVVDNSTVSASEISVEAGIIAKLTGGGGGLLGGVDSSTIVLVVGAVGVWWLMGRD